MAVRNVQRNFTIPDYVHCVDVFGPKDSYLEVIKKDTSAKIKVEGNTISLFGSGREIARIVSVLERMLDVLGQDRHGLYKEDVLLYLQQSKKGNLYMPENGEDILLQIGKRTVRAKNQKQIEFMHSIENSMLTFGIGVAGSAKSFITVITALKLLQEKKINKILLARPPIGLDNGSLDIGFLPGSSDEKLAGFLSPLVSTLQEFLGEERMIDYLERGVIEILPLHQIRGYNIGSEGSGGVMAIIDEAQNLQARSFLSICTRIACNGKMVILGDRQQSDIGSNSGLDQVSKLLEPLDDVSVVRFNKNDIVRSGLTRAILEKFEESGIV